MGKRNNTRNLWPRLYLSKRAKGYLSVASIVPLVVLIVVATLWPYIAASHAQHSASSETTLAHNHTISDITEVYATLYETDDACTNSIDTGAIGTYVPWITAAVAASSGMTTDVADAAGDSVTIPSDGDYAVSFAASFSGTGGAAIIVGITENGSISNARVHRTMSVAGGRGSASKPQTIWTLSLGDVLRLAVDSDGISDTVNICHFSLTVRKLS